MDNPEGSLVDRKWLRAAANLLLAGVVLSVAVGLFHPGREDPNNHPSVFAEYSANAPWTAVHLGQFVGMAVLIAGVLVLFYALNIRTGASGWVSRLAAAAAAISLALYGVLQAVDGVVLKKAVDAWVNAPAAEKAIRFANAESVRWLEEATRSYQEIMLGVAFVLFGLVIVQTARVARPVGLLMLLSGLMFVVRGWVVGMEGFSQTYGLVNLPAYILVIAWIIWLMVTARQDRTVKERLQTAR